MAVVAVVVSIGAHHLRGIIGGKHKITRRHFCTVYYRVCEPTLCPRSTASTYSDVAEAAQLEAAHEEESAPVFHSTELPHEPLPRSAAREPMPEQTPGDVM